MSRANGKEQVQRVKSEDWKAWPLISQEKTNIKRKQASTWVDQPSEACFLHFRNRDCARASWTRGRTRWLKPHTGCSHFVSGEALNKSICTKVTEERAPLLCQISRCWRSWEHLHKNSIWPWHPNGSFSSTVWSLIMVYSAPLWTPNSGFVIMAGCLHFTRQQDIVILPARPSHQVYYHALSRFQMDFLFI